jgi:membrane-bound lytic murein transglycosylase A
MLAFQNSCDAFLKQKPNHDVGSQLINLKAKDWQPACKEALNIDPTEEEQAKTFFEKWFYPIELASKPTRSLFTGYYMPQLKGNLTRTEEFNTPIYGLPTQIKSGALPSYTREAIDNGALKQKAPVIAWINSPIERLFLEIEGSGVIKLTNGRHLYLGYAGENGAPYSSISKVLINKGIMSKDKASKKAIKRYLESQPKKAKELMHQNKSFVFFQKLGSLFGLGAKDIALTPGYSLAIDKKWIPLGAPLWLNTTIPDQHHNNDKRFQRLMIAQDTGGAIKGLMRGDIYWGSGKKAAFLGEHMKNSGHYWLLLPKHAFDRLAGSLHNRF